MAIPRYQWSRKPNRLRELCLNQPPALRAPILVVAVARPDLWSARSKGNNTGLGSPCGDVEFVHAAKFNAAIQGRGSEATRLDTWPARPECRAGMTRHLLVAVGRPDRHQLGA